MAKQFARKIAGVFSIISLVSLPMASVLAQLDTTAPSADTAPAEEMIAPPADTAGPAFISVATASSGETEATVVWTVDEPAYGYIQYGKTTAYGLSTPRSAAAEMDHTVAVTDLTPGTGYHYRIVAEDASGNMSYSKDRTFETALEVIVIDNMPPEIIDVSVAQITTSAATIGWMTDELAQGKVEYGKTAAYGSSSSLATDYATEHAVSLSGLDVSTTYHYRLVVLDESGNQAVSPDEVFSTNAVPPPIEEPMVTEPDSSTGSSISPHASLEPSAVTTTTTATTSPSTTPPASTATTTPQTTATSTPATTPTTETATSTPTTTATTTPLIWSISGVETASVGTSTATIVWWTSEPASAQVWYGASENYASSSAVATARVSSHEIKLTGLKSGTHYFYKVVSQNAAGVTIEKGGFEFNTLFKKKITASAPVISAMRIESVGTSSAVMIFDTNTPATGQVKYGTTTSYRQSDTRHAALLTQHIHPLAGLAAGTRYHFVAIVSDIYGNETIYEDRTFTTLGAAAAPASVSAAGSTAPSAEPITDETTVAPAVSGGGHYSYTRTTTLAQPRLTKSQAMDGQAMFVWNGQKSDKPKGGAVSVGTNIVIVRSTHRYPDDPTSGTIVYRGNSGLFTDTGLENGTAYYYSVFVVNQFNSFSRPARLKVIPAAAEREIALEAVPPVAQKNPIYVFSQAWQIGDRAKQVEHLQVLLASEPSLYPRGFITGYFGSLTRTAVRKFQTRYGLAATGTADAQTLRKLERLASIEIVQERDESADAAFPRDLAIGASGDDVVALQEFLASAEAYPAALATGYFGAMTRAAVQTFQRAQNISPADGYFGPVTRTRVLNLIRLRGISL